MEAKAGTVCGAIIRIYLLLLFLLLHTYPLVAIISHVNPLVVKLEDSCVLLGHEDVHDDRHFS